MQWFEDAVAIVTGGGMGLGAALCEELASRGATVVVADIDGDAARQVAQRLGQSDASAVAVRVDVANDAEVAQLIESVVAEYGRLDYMINNAGIAIGGDSRDLSMQQWRRVLDVDLLGVCIRDTARLSGHGGSRPRAYRQRFLAQRAGSPAWQ